MSSRLLKIRKNIDNYNFFHDNDFFKISKNYYFLKLMDDIVNEDFCKNLQKCDIEIQSDIQEELYYQIPLLISINVVFQYIKFNNPEEEIQFLLMFKNYKDKNRK